MPSEESPAKTMLALHREQFGTPISRLARALEADRNYIYHLIDPLHPSFRYHTPSAELLQRLAIYLKKKRSAVVADYEAAVSLREAS